VLRNVGLREDCHVNETRNAKKANGHRPRTSLRARVRLWTVTVFTVTLVAFTAAGIVEERRQLLQAESAHAAALLAHLARMPEFRAGAADAGALLDILRGSSDHLGGSLELGAPVSNPQADELVLARRQLDLEEGELELRYRADAGRLGTMTRRAILIHSLHGLVALGALLLGTEWILRRSLVLPLGALSHEVGLMRDGRGWRPRLPATDGELQELANAVAGLGPSLEKQVHEWIGVQKRGAVALALTAVRARLRDTQQRVLALVAELEGETHAPPRDRERRIHSLAAEVRRLPELLAEDAHALVATTHPHATGDADGMP
jgi:hypothetical protein